MSPLFENLWTDRGLNVVNLDIEPVFVWIRINRPFRQFPNLSNTFLKRSVRI